MRVIEVNNLTKDYGNHKGVFDVSFHIGEGEVFGFLGPNGAGKTTTIRHLLGFLNSDKGSCSILGKNCRTQTAEIMKDLGYLPAEISFFNGMKGLEFLEFMTKMRKLEDTTYRDELVEQFQLDTKGSIKRMSKGMKQKLGIICAFMHDPQVLILDEPTSGLDPLMQNTFTNLILEEKKKGKTILMSSHNSDEVNKTCDRIGIIREGTLITTEDIHILKTTKRKSYLITFASLEEARSFQSSYPNSTLQTTETQVKVTLQGELTHLLRSLSEYRIIDLEVTHQNLEEILMHYYKQ